MFSPFISSVKCILIEAHDKPFLILEDLMMPGGMSNGVFTGAMAIDINVDGRLMTPTEVAEYILDRWDWIRFYNVDQDKGVLRAAVGTWKDLNMEVRKIT